MAEIVVGFEGSCPHSPEGVCEEGENRFRILPSWRPSPGISEEAVGRSTRLGFRVVNKSHEAEAVELLIDYQYDDAPQDASTSNSREQYMSYRDFVVVREPGEANWRTVMGDVEGTVATFQVTVPPGETEIHWHPPYTYSQSEALVASLRDHPLVQVEPIGKSEEGRNLWMLRITDASTRPKKPAMIVDRFHAYESAASYTMEGMVQWLLSGEPWAVAALRTYVFHVIPMANPDGVVNGMGRLTAPQGADLVFWPATADSTHRAIVEATDRVRPKLHVTLHNWQNKLICETGVYNGETESGTDRMWRAWTGAWAGLWGVGRCRSGGLCRCEPAHGGAAGRGI